MHKIRIYPNGTHAIVLVNGCTESAVRNWKQLQPAAKKAIRENTSAQLQRPGLYDCPAELAAQAR